MFSYKGNMSTSIGSSGVKSKMLSRLPGHTNQSLGGIFQKKGPGVGRTSMDRFVNDYKNATFDGQKKYSMSYSLQNKMPIMAPSMGNHGAAYK